MRKFLQCSLLLMIFCQGGGNGVYATKVRAMIPVTSDSAPVPAVPYTGTYQNGVLNTAPKYYDLRVTGKCDTNSTEKAKLEIKGFDEAPNFFKEKDGTEIVFAEPSPMATVQLPSGYTAYVTITLSSVTAHVSEFTDTLKKYLALGIHLKGAEKGKYEDVLYLDDNPSECFHMNDKNVLELVPLVSSTVLPTFTPINDGDPLSKCPAITGTLVETGFNFGSIFKAEAKCTDVEPEKQTTWEKQNWTGSGSVPGILNNSFSYANKIFLFSHGSSKVMINKNSNKFESVALNPGSIFYSQILKQYIYISTVGKVCTSVSGDEWIANTNMDIDTTTSGSLVARTNIGERFIVISGSGYMWSLVDGEQTWNGPVEPHANLTALDGVLYLSYGDGVIVAVSNDKLVSVGTVDINGNITDWSSPKKLISVTTFNNAIIKGLAFGEGKFLAVNNSGNLVSSIDGYDWEDAGSTGYNGNIYGLVHDGNSFCALTREPDVLRSPKNPYIDLTNK